MIDNPSHQPSLACRIQFGPYEVDLHTQELWKEGIRVKLARQPFQILAMLVSHPGQLVTREELQQKLWPEDTFTDFNHGLNAAVNKLREALHDTAGDPKYVETLPRRGYRFIGAIELNDPQPAVKTVPPANPAVIPPIPVAATQTLMHTWRRFASFGVVALVTFIVGAIFVLSPERNQEGSSTSQVFPEVPTARQSQPAAPQVGEELAKPEAEAAQPEVEAKQRERRHERPQPSTEVAYAPPPPVFREAGTSQPATVRTIISNEGGNAAPQFSPDGRRIAFMSNRSGPWQIWVSNVDGSDPVQLSHTDSAGTPRWSPDGGSIVFDAPTDEGSGIYMIAADGRGGARLVVQGQVPSFSRDGRYVYFASDRSGDLQVWKVPLNGGQPQQVTRQGGFAALEGSDGYLYYTKQPGNNPEICRVAVSGSDENCTLPHLRPRTWSSWAVTRHGIMFAEDMPGGKAALSVYEPAKQQVRDLVWLPSPPVWMGARPDGTQAIVNDVAERRISVVENLR